MPKFYKNKKNFGKNGDNGKGGNNSYSNDGNGGYNGIKQKWFDQKKWFGQKKHEKANSSDSLNHRSPNNNHDKNHPYSNNNNHGNGKSNGKGSGKLSGKDWKNNDNNMKSSQGTCSWCGCKMHKASTCSAPDYERTAWSNYQQTGILGPCTYCSLTNHLPSDCRSFPAQLAHKNAQNDNYNNHNNSRRNGGLFCKWCKLRTNHNHFNCELVKHWEIYIEREIITKALLALPWCVVCKTRNDHDFRQCPHDTLKDLAIGAFQRQIAELKECWLHVEDMQAANGGQIDELLACGVPKPPYCGICLQFGHGTGAFDCPQRQNELADLFNNHYTAAIEGRRLPLANINKPLARKQEILAGSDGPGQSNQYKWEQATNPIIQKYCPKCNSAVPAEVRCEKGGIPILIRCTKPDCSKMILISTERNNDKKRSSHNEDDNDAEDNDETITYPDGGIVMHRRKRTKATQAHEPLLQQQSSTPWDTWSMTPLTDGSAMHYWHAATGGRMYSTWQSRNNKVPHNLNECHGNAAPALPPLRIAFSAEDRRALADPTAATNMARAGLVPICGNCGVYGIVADRELDCVMGNTLDLDGNMAGAGVGNVLWRNQGLEFANQGRYGPRCLCWGAEPERVIWRRFEDVEAF